MQTVLLNWIDTREKEQAKQEEKEREARKQQIQQQAEDRWNACREEILKLVTKDESRRIFGSIDFYSFDPEKRLLILQLARREDYDWLEQPAVIQQLLQPYLTKYFGKGTKLSYRLP